MSRHVSFVSPEESLTLEPRLERGRQNDPVTIGPNTRSSWLYFIIGVSTISIVSLWLFLTTTMPLPESRIKPNPTLSQCGNSADEAAGLGCHFDIMSFSWLPPACFDEQLTHEFDSMENWQWFLDQNATQPVSKEEVLRGEQDLFVPFRYHKHHCTFMWKKLHRAVEKGGLIDSYIGNYNHTMHCEQMLLREEDGSGMLNTRIFRKFPSCE